jgi:hypothetical protein
MKPGDITHDLQRAVGPFFLTTTLRTTGSTKSSSLSWQLGHWSQPKDFATVQLSVGGIPAIILCGLRTNPCITFLTAALASGYSTIVQRVLAAGDSKRKPQRYVGKATVASQHGDGINNSPPTCFKSSLQLVWFMVVITLPHCITASSFTSPSTPPTPDAPKAPGEAYMDWVPLFVNVIGPIVVVSSIKI